MDAVTGVKRRSESFGEGDLNSSDTSRRSQRKAKLRSSTTRRQGFGSGELRSWSTSSKF
jgi:hypothetical protein